MRPFGFGRKKTTVGLDVGSGYIKAAVIDHSKDAPQLEKIAVSPLEGDAIVDGDIVDPGLVADAISSMFEREKIDQRDVVIGVGGRDVIIKLIKMDRMEEEEAREVIPWEAEQHVPFDMDNVQLDFEITDPDGDGLQMTVLLVAAKRELIETRISLLQQAGLNPRTVDVEAFALHNALEVNYPNAMDGITALVNIGHDTTTVNVLDNGVPVLTRDLTFGTRGLILDLQRERSLTAEQAEAVLRGESDNAALRDFLVERSQEVARGVERAAAFLETDEIGLGVGRLYLCGGGVGVPSLSEVLAERLGVETHIASAFERIQVKADAVDYMQLQEMAPMLMLSVGLGLRAA
ncbi:MAG: type IV pilus assembly protein PilM [Gemmatimonadota bacterium]|nr:type IV pilus assembly protein PilM [Gemmatimonadota bacterium]